jgi:ribosome biogenesis GTPase
VAAESFRITQVLVFNKRDLLSEEAIEYQQGLIDLYSRLGVLCITTSAAQKDISSLHDVLRNKVTLVAGHSGVGKSSLLNLLSPSIEQKTGDISGYSEKGTHTTTFAEMFQLDDRTFVIDTPGVKEWGVVDMNDQELSDYFPEMRDLRNDCKYGSRCLHLEEPGCVIIPAVQRGDIALSRYESYLSILSKSDNRR